MKVKKSVKIIMLLLIVLCIYLIYKFLLFNEYSKYRSYITHVNETSTVLNNVVFPDVRITKGIFILDNLSIGNSFDSISKDNDSWLIKDGDKEFKFKIKEESLDNYRLYQLIISNLTTVNNNKYNYFTSSQKIKENLRITKNAYKMLPQFEEIFLVDGNKKHGYIYKINNEIDAVIYISDKKYHFIFENSNLDYEYIVKILSTLTLDD